MLVAQHEGIPSERTCAATLAECHPGAPASVGSDSAAGRCGSLRTRMAPPAVAGAVKLRTRTHHRVRSAGLASRNGGRPVPVVRAVPAHLVDAAGRRVDDHEVPPARPRLNGTLERGPRALVGSLDDDQPDPDVSPTEYLFATAVDCIATRPSTTSTKDTVTRRRWRTKPPHTVALRGKDAESHRPVAVHGNLPVAERFCSSELTGALFTGICHSGPG